MSSRSRIESKGGNITVGGGSAGNGSGRRPGDAQRDVQEGHIGTHGRAAALRRCAAHGFDAEAPIHFFPELIVLLQQARKRKTREESTLRAADFITQRNYGIYFDIETEERMIAAGLKEYADFKTMVRQRLKARGRGKLAASDGLGGKDAELTTAYQEVVDELHPAAPAYREHIADLLSMSGVTIRRRR